MGYKIVNSYIISSLIFAILFVLASLLFKSDIMSFRAPTGFIEYVRYFLFWILIGLLISIILIIIGKTTQKPNTIVEFVVSILTTAIALALVSYGIKAPVEGLYVLFALGGIVSGLFIFFIKRIIFRNGTLSD